jgi:histone H3/H4
MADVLVVASKIKKYIKEKSGMNTSANSMEALSALVGKACDQAIENAKTDGRKTVMDRDIQS